MKNLPQVQSLREVVLALQIFLLRLRQRILKDFQRLVG
jgi:hypothetical protein